MARSNQSEDNDYGIMYYDDPHLGKTLSAAGALAPWFLCVLLFTPALMAFGTDLFTALIISPWIGFVASVLWIRSHFQ